jgi:ATP-dependent Clp protease adapter protein ClpS
MGNPAETGQPEADTDIGVANNARVILFNDEWHTFDEVISQIIKAISCSRDKAESLTWEVHTKGKACVFEGEINECLKVSSVLEEIALHTQIEY